MYAATVRGFISSPRIKTRSFYLFGKEGYPETLNRFGNRKVQPLQKWNCILWRKQEKQEAEI